LSFLDLSSLGYVSSSGDLYAEWLNFMQVAVPGYIPAPAGLENIDAQATAAMGSDVAQVGVVVPPAIVRVLGTKLFGVPYLTGASAIAVVQVIAQDTDGPYTVDAGTDLLLNGTAFDTLADLTIPNGSTTGQVIVAATTPGTASNGFGNPASFVSQIDWVASVSAVTSSSGGVDAESDTDYQNRLVRQLRLQAPRPITAADFATMALSFQPASGTDQEEVGRATAIDGYSPSAATFVVSANSTTTLTVTTPPAAGITAAQGASITGTDIQSGTIVDSSTSSTILLSKTASGTASGISATVTGTLGNERTVTVAITDTAGGLLNADTKTALSAWLESFRELNFVVNVINPTVTTVYASIGTVYIYPGFDPTATAAAIQAAVINFLSQATFGAATFGDKASWFTGTTVYINQIIGVIQNAGRGAVRAVGDGALTIGLSPSPSGVVDVVLPGPLGLPTSTTSTVGLPTIVVTG
jgi:hypothetical protein